MIHALLALFISALTALVLQRKATPDHASDFRFADTVALLFGTVTYLFFLLITARPLVAVFFSILTTILLYIVNKAKKAALRGEPLLFSDVTLVRQVLEFPSLYLPFLPVRTILFSLLFIIPLTYLFWNVSTELRARDYAIFAAFLFLPPLLFFFRRLSARCPLTFSGRDADRYGPFGCALLHFFWHVFQRGKTLGIRGDGSIPFAPTLWGREILTRGPRLAAKKERLPDIVLIQEESFCVPGSYLPEGHAENLLKNFERMAGQGLLTSLSVHAYGAYTMRTEYEVLSGIEPVHLGTDAFHPYWSVRNKPSWSLARYLKSLGYRCICVHPFARTFFYRDRALPNLGFDHFIALDNFPEPEYFGPHVSDASVARCLLGELERESAPLFCFVITMENHGPWREDRFRKCGPEPELARGIDPSVARYLVHIRNCDQMLGYLSEKLSRRVRPALLALYGDHLPGLPKLIPDWEQNTPCLFWSTEGKAVFGDSGESRILAPAEVGGVLLAALFRLVEDSLGVSGRKS